MPPSHGMAFDPTAKPLETKVNYNDTEETLEQQEKKEKMLEYADQRLKHLVSSDEMYKAIEYYLLGDPQRQIEQLQTILIYMIDYVSLIKQKSMGLRGPNFLAELAPCDNSLLQPAVLHPYCQA